MLKGVLPFPAMGLDAPAIGFKGYQMSYLVYQGYEKSIRVWGSIHRDLMRPIGEQAVISVPGHPFIHYLEVYPVGADQIKTRDYGRRWQVSFQNAVHRKQK
ncbi:hypothetical protein GCM10011361_21780 [Muriicola marianensis]|uniref:Uncharacterized protein n=1 Tax=Muriicola marianensis TaxID=1324801 RepID=A0ABQ1R3E6_9FLAO|nr:hypothetical protein GCM10011361_21780 [Muriicola marianensis]